MNEHETQPAYFDAFEIVHKPNAEKLTVTSWTDYYPFGKVAKTACSGAGAYRYGYQGEFAEKDNETEWNSFELRQYDSEIGRFTTTDPMGEFWSSYVGMGNDPVNLTDPTGGETNDIPEHWGRGGFCGDGGSGDMSFLGGMQMDNWMRNIAESTKSLSASAAIHVFIYSGINAQGNEIFSRQEIEKTLPYLVEIYRRNGIVLNPTIVSYKQGIGKGRNMRKNQALLTLVPSTLDGMEAMAGKMISGEGHTTPVSYSIGFAKEGQYYLSTVGFETVSPSQGDKYYMTAYTMAHEILHQMLSIAGGRLNTSHLESTPNLLISGARKDVNYLTRQPKRTHSMELIHPTHRAILIPYLKR